MNKKYKVGSFGLFTSLIVTVIGIGIFSYPRQVVTLSGNDSVLATVISGIINILVLLFIEGAIKLNNYKDLDEILKDNFGSLISRIILIIISIYFLFIISFALRVFSGVVKTYLLPKTPIEFIIVSLLLTGTYHLRKGIENIISFNEIIFWCMFIPAVSLLIFTLKEADFTNLLPMFTTPPLNFVGALWTSIYSFAGFEIIYFLMPKMKNVDKVKKTSVGSMIFITVFYTAVIITVLSVFTKQDITHLMYSLITLSKIIDIPGAFVERWYGIALTLWVLFYYTTFINLYCFGAVSMANVFKFKDIKLILLIFTPIIYLFSLIPENPLKVERLAGNIVPYLYIFTAFIVPAMLYIKALFRRKRRKK